MAGSFGGPTQESQNAKIPEQPRRRDTPPGAAGRAMIEGSDLENGIFMKERFATEDGEDIVGKQIPQSGTPPWDKPLEFTGEGPSVEDTFGEGERHTIKNG